MANAQKEQCDVLCELFEMNIINTLGSLPKSDMEILKLEVGVYLFTKVKKFKLDVRTNSSSASDSAASGSDSASLTGARASDPPHSQADTMDIQLFAACMASSLRTVDDVGIQRTIFDQTMKRMSSGSLLARQKPRNSMDRNSLVDKWLSSTDDDARVHGID